MKVRDILEVEIKALGKTLGAFCLSDGEGNDVIQKDGGMKTRADFERKKTVFGHEIVAENLECVSDVLDFPAFFMELCCLSGFATLRLFRVFPRIPAKCLKNSVHLNPTDKVLFFFGVKVSTWKKITLKHESHLCHFLESSRLKFHVGQIE